MAPGPKQEAAQGHIQAHVQGVNLAQLDARLAALQLNGDIQLQAPAQTATELQLSGELHAQRSAVTDKTPSKDTSPREATLHLQAVLNEHMLRLTQARLVSGAASLQVQGLLQRKAAAGGETRAGEASSAWQAQGQLQAQNFDPRLIWAGAAGSPWRSSASALSLNAQARLQGRGISSPPEGELTIDLQPSLWAGQPLQGHLSYVHTAAPVTLAAELRSGDNQLQLQMQGQGGGSSGRLSQWQGTGQLQAPQLAAFAPWLRMLWPQAQLNGSLQAHWTAQAHGPAGPTPSNAAAWTFNSQGDLALAGLTLADMSGQGVAGLPALHAEHATLNWNLGSDLHQALGVHARLEQVQIGDRALPSAELQLSGSWAQQQLSLQAQSGALPLPAALTAWLGLDNSPASSQLELKLRGAFEQSPLQSLLGAKDSAQDLHWQSQIQALQWQTLPAPGAAGAQAVLAAVGPGEPSLQLRYHPDIGLTSLQLTPGSLSLGAARLRWQAIHWDAPRALAEPSRVEIDASLDALPLAPVLARLQPDFGWAGDLAISGQLHVLRGTDNTRLNLRIERQQGDLNVSAERGRQALGLSEFRFELNADHGDWTLTQALAGTNLGGLAGGLGWHAAPTALTPALDAPLQGSFQANVSNLGTWGAWVPPG
ncbi:MAG: hypothetical protein JO370_10135, partial [Paucibacter sp.]|nr:hypothetical protein [Roseateles sp.]